LDNGIRGLFLLHTGDVKPRPAPTATAEYRPGACNIGPAEIARRRRTGHMGVLLAVALFVALVALDVPPLVRFLVALPAAVAATGYLQAWLRFCVGFAALGVFNFGPLGGEQRIDDPVARARDRARAVRLTAAAALIGAAVGAVAVLLPL
jgi:hypothetical protein